MSTGIENARSEVIAPRYAEVAIPLHVRHTFQYRLKESMRREAQVGARILVPLGRTKVTGYIVALYENLNRENSVDEADIKEVENVLDLIPVCTPEILEITRWVSDYYGSAWGEVIKAALPPGISPATKVVLSLTDKGRAKAETLSDSSKNTPTTVVLLALYRAGEITADSFHGQMSRPQLSRAIRELEREELLQQQQTIPERKVKEKLSKAVRLLTPVDWISDSRMTNGQERVLSTLEAKGAPLSLIELLQAADVGPSTVKSLARKGLLEIFEQPVRRDPLFRAELPEINQHELTQDQSDVLAAIQTQLHSASYGSFLLHGVTGSGKTEVYIRAIRTTLRLDRSAIMLVPEIALTPLFSRRLRAEFGDLVAIFHSSLAKGERFDEWMRVKNGEARLVIGTRSAVFAPVKNLGLMIVDEEHESTYRQQDSPHYHGRDTAIVRAQKEFATVVLGSATPSLESFHNSSSGKSTYLSLPRRIGNRSMALAEIIDMRKIFAKHGRPKIFSDELLEAIRANQERKEQAIILLNRRGYSSFVLCRSCGETIQCPNCDVTLTYHRSERVIICHYCNHREPSPSECPTCGKNYIYYVGEGTEQIEQILCDLFPELRIARIDRDTSARRGQFEKALLDFGAGRLDMLVGTQMLAKGHDFPNVTLVGVVSVDAGLALPDFRAAERTFQLITQVAGRAGRGELGGKVLIQTYHPDHYALRHACAQDYTGFYEEEIRYRQNHQYPPFVSLALFLVHGKDLARVRADALQLRKELDQANKERNCRVLGPAPAPLSRLKGEHRFQLLIKARNRRQLRAVTDVALKAALGRDLNPRSVNLEIDPVSIM